MHSSYYNYYKKKKEKVFLSLLNAIKQLILLCNLNRFNHTVLEEEENKI